MKKQTNSQARSNIQWPSMAQDMQKGRKTEVGELNGFIVQKAKEAGCPAPTHERLVEIDVSSLRTAEGHPVVVISDNGKGLSLDFDERGHTGAGFQIIRALAQKLQANLTIESNEHGLTFHVLLPARVDWPEMAPPLQAVG